MELKTFFQENPKVALAFSGGTDSAYLLYAAVKAGAEVKPFYIKTVFQPRFELEHARRLAKELKLELEVLELDVLARPQVAENPGDRCYHCKKALFGVLKEKAAAAGYQVLMDGTNASDDAGDRPGMKALTQLKVRSPLRECGITKSEIRRLSREAGLFAWDKPAYACLATRLPTGQALTADILAKVEAAEAELFRLGFQDFRVRVFGGAARLQLPEGQLVRAVEAREEILGRLKPYFEIVLLDLAAR